MPLDPEPLDELRAAVGSEGDEELTIARWDAFHKSWLDASRMEAHLMARVATKQLRAEMQSAREEAAATLKQKESEWSQELVKARQNAAESVAPTKLLAAEADKERRKRGKWFEEQESAAAAAAYRSLEPAMWAGVREGVGGLDLALEEIRRRVWTPLCAPRSVLDELGAERVKGLLLYGPPGCGKSYLAARLASGLSRRPPTIISGPEIMDKYVGSSEAQLRQLFTSPPQVPPRPGDAADVMMVAEANELHVIVLDEFDAIARRRSDGMKGDTSTRDSVVNQLLVLMDGVAQLPVPTFVLALTNRRELIDGAILRPGRLEVHVEVDRPDERGRATILQIHAETMRASGRLSLEGSTGFADADGGDTCTLGELVGDEAYGTWTEGVAARTSGFSGAAMAAVVRAAVARALDRSVSADDVAGCRVTADDFEQAISDVRTSSLELERRMAAVDADDDVED